MIPSNFIPAGPIKKQRFIPYTDGSPSREVEDELMKEFTEGLAYRKPSILNVRDALDDICDLLQVTSYSLMADKPSMNPLYVHNILQMHVIPKLVELEKELARL